MEQANDKTSGWLNITGSNFFSFRYLELSTRRFESCAVRYILHNVTIRVRIDILTCDLLRKVACGKTYHNWANRGVILPTEGAFHGWIMASIVRSSHSQICSTLPFTLTDYMVLDVKSALLGSSIVYSECTLYKWECCMRYTADNIITYLLRIILEELITCRTLGRRSFQKVCHL